MKKYPVLFLIIFSLLILFGCRKIDNNNVNRNSTDIFPNKVGDTWLYKVNDTTESFGANNNNIVTQYNMTVSVIDSVQLPGGIKANVWVCKYNGTTDTNYVYQTGDTIRFLDYAKSDIVRQYVIPLSIHNSWDYNYLSPAVCEVTVDMQANITVEGNKFSNAFHIYGYGSFPDYFFSTDEWIENNVGVVKRYFIHGGLIPREATTWSLVSYHLK